MSQAAPKGPIRILMIGPEPPPIGGTTVLFRSLVEALEGRSGVMVTVVNTVGVRGRGAAGLLSLTRLVASIFRGMRRADVAALHIATTGLHLLGPITACAASLSGTPLIIRKFGGTDFLEYGSVRRTCILWALRHADLYLAETRQLAERGRIAGLATQWYPNSRPTPGLPLIDDPERTHCRRFVFLGQIRSEKGVRELVEAGSRLPDGVTVDLYGDVGFDIPRSALDGIANVDYRGEVEPGDVHNLLLSYDALVLPSYREGYPGAVLEAFGAGLPVVVSRLEGICEIVDDTCGIFVEPHDAESLNRAMLSLVEDRALHSRLLEGVRRTREQFSDEVWQERFLEYCRSLARC